MPRNNKMTKRDYAIYSKQMAQGNFRRTGYASYNEVPALTFKQLKELTGTEFDSSLIKSLNTFQKFGDYYIRCIFRKNRLIEIKKEDGIVESYRVISGLYLD